MCFGIFDIFNITNYIQIIHLSCPNQFICKLCRRLTRSTTPWQIKYKPSASNYHLAKFGIVGTPALNAEACELANLLAPVSQLCQKLNVLQALQTPVRSKFIQAGSLVRVWRTQLCSCRYVRITRLLSTPLVLRIGDWLWVLPEITLVVDKSKKINKAVSLDWLVVNC